MNLIKKYHAVIMSNFQENYGQKKKNFCVHTSLHIDDEDDSLTLAHCRLLWMKVSQEKNTKWVT